MDFNRGKFVSPLFALLLFISFAGLCGCATLPTVSEMIDTVPVIDEPPQIVSAGGLLSKEESRAIMERLKGPGAPIDILQRHIEVVESISGSRLISGNKVTLLIDGPAVYSAMFDAIRNAEDHINIETFTFEDDEAGRKFSDLLLQKQSEGVRVNVIYDSAGSFRTPTSFFQRLRDGGINVVEYNPLTSLAILGKWQLVHRDHRKIMVVDGKVAITGGVNISRNYFTHVASVDASEKEGTRVPWCDTDVKIEGPAVAEFQKVFIGTWKSQKGPALSDNNYFPELQDMGTSLVQIIGSTQGQMNRMTFVLYISALTFAGKSIHMTNAYFVPDYQILTALTDAAQRGVDVRIVLPKVSIHPNPTALYAGQYYYSGLLRSGVKLYERCNATLHAKTAVIDGVWSTVGSTNMDFLSFLRNDEVNTIILNREFASGMATMFEADIDESDMILWEEWKERPLWPRITEWFANLLSCWL
jgi:cardiolipin synthase